jgi:hypothetical protein
MIDGSSGPLKNRPLPAGVDSGPCAKTPSDKSALTRQSAASLSCELPLASSSLITINTPVRMRLKCCGSIVTPDFQFASLKMWTKSLTKSFTSGSSFLASTMVTLGALNAPSLVAIRLISSALSLLGSNLRSILSNSRRSRSAFSFASAARAVASAARAPASAIALSVASFSCLAVSAFSDVNRRFKRRDCTPATAPTNASVAPITTSQKDIPSQSDAQDSSDIRMLIALAVLFYGFVFMAVRARRK